MGSWLARVGFAYASFSILSFEFKIICIDSGVVVDVEINYRVNNLEEGLKIAK